MGTQTQQADLTEQIAESARQPAEARGDSASVRQHSLPDQIAADKYLASKSGARKKGFGLRFARIDPGGSV